MKVYVLVETTYYENPKLENASIVSIHKNPKIAKLKKRECEEVEKLLRSGYKSNTVSFYKIVPKDIEE